MNDICKTTHYILDNLDESRAAVSREVAKVAYQQLLTDIIDGLLDDKGYEITSKIVDVCAYAAWHIEGFDGESHTASYDLFDKAADKNTELLRKCAASVVDL